MTAAELRAWRRRVGWSQAQLGAKLGLTMGRDTRGYRRSVGLGSWERGRTPVPKWVPLALFAIERGYTLRDVPQAANMPSPKRKLMRRWSPEEIERITAMFRANPAIGLRAVAIEVGRHVNTVTALVGKLKREGRLTVATKRTNFTDAEKAIIRAMEGQGIKAMLAKLPGRSDNQVRSICHRMGICGRKRHSPKALPAPTGMNDTKASSMPSFMSDAFAKIEPITGNWRSAVSGPARSNNS